MMILIAGPYRSGTGDDPARMAANVAEMECFALPLFRAGHTPIVGEWLALPLVALAGSQRVGDAAFDEIFHPIAERLLARCDAVLRVGGSSQGADLMVTIARERGLAVYHALREVPGCESFQEPVAEPGAPANRVSFEPIGRVRSPFVETAQIPKGLGAEHRAEGTLELDPSFEAGLADIEGFSHLYVLWVFDRVDGVELTARPPSDDRPHGVFATRSPRRPNPIGLTVVELLGRDGCTLRVSGVDMLDGTPILDIKPYLSNVPPEQMRRGWLADAERRGAR